LSSFFFERKKFGFFSQSTSPNLPLDPA